MIKKFFARAKNLPKDGDEEVVAVEEHIGQVSRIQLLLMVAAVGAPYFISNFHRLSLGVLGRGIAEDFGLSTSQLGILGAALFYSYSLAQLLSGVAADKLQTRTLIVTSCLVTGMSVLWFSRAENFISLVASRFLTGTAIAFIYVPALTSFRRWFGDRLFGTVAGFLGAMGQLGSISASMPLKLAADAMGWRDTFIFLGCVSLLLAVIAFFCVLKNPKKVLQRELFTENRETVLLNPSFLIVSAWFFVTGGTRIAFQSLWGTNFFVQALGKNMYQSSLFLMWQSVGCIFGSILLGCVSDVLGSMRTLVLSGIVLSATWIALGTSGPTTSDWSIGIFNLLLGALGAGGITVAFSSIRLFSKGANTGLLIGFNNCAIFLGSALVTQGIGYFMQTPDPLARKYSLLWFCCAALCLIVTLVVAWVNRSRFEHFVGCK
jgi:sugar phosphate permease